MKRFVDFAETFHLPVVHFVDNPGFMIGKQAEQEATIRAGARALTAIYQSTMPWCSVMHSQGVRRRRRGAPERQQYNYRYAWPSADWGSLPIEGGIEAAYKAELDAAADPAAHLAAIRRA